MTSKDKHFISEAYKTIREQQISPDQVSAGMNNVLNMAQTMQQQMPMAAQQMAKMINPQNIQQMVPAFTQLLNSLNVGDSNKSIQEFDKFLTAVGMDQTNKQQLISAVKSSVDKLKATQNQMAQPVTVNGQPVKR